MKSVIVPIFSEADLQALPNCLRYLAQQNVQTLLVLHGPNVGVVNADVTKDFDVKISEQETRKRELTLVEDYAGAQKAKEQIETLRVERDMAIRESWKKVPEDQRQALYKKAFANIGTEPLCLREAYQHDQVFTMLQAFLPQMPSDLPHGEFAIIWPRSVAAVSAQAKIATITKGHVKEYDSKWTDTTARAQREQELKSAHHMKVIGTAQKAGINTKGMKVPEVIKALLDKEFAEPVAA